MKDFTKYYLGLRGMATNLNQMARVYNRNQGYVKDYKLGTLLKEIQDLVLALQEVYIIPQKAGEIYGNNKTMEVQKQTWTNNRICN